MLFGGYQHNIDKKGRVFIPAKLREELGTSFMICRGIYGKRCLCVYSSEQWERLVEKIGTLPSTKSSAVKRFLYDGAGSRGTARSLSGGGDERAVRPFDGDRPGEKPPWAERDAGMAPAAFDVNDMRIHPK